MSLTIPIEANHLKIGSYVMICDFPCRIKTIKKSKTGKHGHAKCNIVGIDVLYGKKYNEVHAGHIMMRAFEFDKKQYELTNVDEKQGFFDLMENNDKNAEQKKFPIDFQNSKHKELIHQFEKGKFIEIVVITAPVGNNNDTQLVSIFESWSVMAD